MRHELITHTTAAARELLAALEVAIERACEAEAREERAEADLADSHQTHDRQIGLLKAMQARAEKAEADLVTVRRQQYDAQDSFAEMAKELEAARKAQAEATTLRAQLAELQERMKPVAEERPQAKAGGWRVQTEENPDPNYLLDVVLVAPPRTVSVCLDRVWYVLDLPPLPAAAKEGQ